MVVSSQAYLGVIAVSPSVVAVRLLEDGLKHYFKLPLGHTPWTHIFDNRTATDLTFTKEVLSP